MRPAYRQLWTALLVLWALALALFPQARSRPGKPSPGWPPQTFTVFYGDWNGERVGLAQGFDLVIAQAGRTLSKGVLSRIQRGRDGRPQTADDVLVLAYVSLGEDREAPLGPQTTGDGPRCSTGLEKAGYPDYYLDELVLETLDGKGAPYWKLDADGRPLTHPGQDGLPDRNGVWGSYYVDVGNAAWQARTRNRMRELVELGVDGFFFDTLDTASPDGRYGYLQDGLLAWLQRLRTDFPEHYLVANRGIFLSHSPAFHKSLDALLLESFVTHWDWERGYGVLSPYLSRDAGALESGQLPPYRLWLDYLDPAQSDMPVLLHTRADLAGSAPAAFYCSHPFLQAIAPVMSSYFPGQAPGSLAPIEDLTVEAGPGTLTLKVRPEGGVLDLRVGSQGSPTTWARLLTDAQGLASVELEPATAYRVAARRLGPAADLRTDWVMRDFTTPAGPPPVRGLQILEEDGAVQLSWEAEAPQPVRCGPAPDQLSEVGQGRGSFRISNLTNDQKIYVQVGLVPPRPARPHQLSLPPAPEEVQAYVSRQVIVVSWKRLSGLADYRVYCWQEPGGPRLPLEVRGVSQTEIGPLPSGTYRVFVTAVDDQRREGPPHDSLTVVVP